MVVGIDFVIVNISIMFPYKFTLFAFFDLFKTEADAVEFLLEKGILHCSALCVPCNRPMNIQKSTRFLDNKCLRCTSCKRVRSMRTGTFLENSKVTAREFLLFLYHWCNDASIE